MGQNHSVIALAGNPNVGKSTVFNALTGMNQHTGNWTGKTVATARGCCRTEKGEYVLVDVPGTYSLMARSHEEEVARDFICFGEKDAVVVVCDATCLERNLNLVLQILEATSRVLVCVNLMDEARRKHISVDVNLLSSRLGVPVVGISARNKKTLARLTRELDTLCGNTEAEGRQSVSVRYSIKYPAVLEESVARIAAVLQDKNKMGLGARWLALRLLEGDESFAASLENYLGHDIACDEGLRLCVSQELERLEAAGVGREALKDTIVASVINESEEISRECVTFGSDTYDSFDRRVDRVVTGRLLGYPLMLLLLAFIFWLTISGANYPSEMLSDILFSFQDTLSRFFVFLGAPQWLHDITVFGIYRVLAWVISVMLPPMAIFFPLFTLLEDIGYLPRIAYNLDAPFKKCSACGKQALTMCMGFGCNAVGIMGSRIIDSQRERLLAALTNSFVPCNGRFPAMIAIITMFFCFGMTGWRGGMLSALILTAVVLLGVAATFAATKLLSVTFLCGVPSSFTLEMPSYRRPKVLSILVRSLFDRTLFVLARAVSVAAPAGAILWLAANITVGDASLLGHCAAFLDPLGRIIGLDGVILIAFILGSPANEIVIPIIIMGYTANSTIIHAEGLAQMKELFTINGWTPVTAVCTVVFMLFHWPCITSLLTLRKETGSTKWALLSAVLPTLFGFLLCFLIKSTASLLGI